MERRAAKSLARQAEVIVTRKAVLKVRSHRSVIAKGSKGALVSCFRTRVSDHCGECG